jgi:Ribonuclease G/E
VSANLILAVTAALAVWAGSLYLRPFGRCPRCRGKGHVKRGPRRRPACPRCKGRRRVQRTGSRTIHRAARKIRQGRQAAARYQQDEESQP